MEAFDNVDGMGKMASADSHEAHDSISLSALRQLIQTEIKLRG
jgi:hypothetical protein